MYDHEEQRPAGRRAHPVTPQAAVGLQQTIGNAAFSRLVGGQSETPVQRTVEVGSDEIKLREKDQLPDKYGPEYFTFTKKREKELFPRADTRRKKLVKYQEALQKCLIEMIKSPILYQYSSYVDLRRGVAQYYAEQQGPKISAAGPSLKKGEFSPEAAKLHKVLADSKRVFPEEKLAELAWKASLPGNSTGFLFELALAVEAINRNKSVLVQLGTLSLQELVDHLKGKPSDGERRPPPGSSGAGSVEGPIGADLVVWQPREEQGNGKEEVEEANGEEKAKPAGREFNGEFIQAKSCQFHTADDCVKEARSQLEGRNKKNRGTVAKDREISLVGARHKGIIALQVWGAGDPSQLEKEAHSALASEHVHLVRIQYMLDGTVCEFAKDGTVHKSSPGPSPSPKP